MKRLILLIFFAALILSGCMGNNSSSISAALKSSTSISSATSSKSPSTTNAPPTDEQMAEMKELLSSATISVIDMSLYKSASPPISQYDLLKLFGKTLYNGQVALYLVKDGDAYFSLQCDINIDMPKEYTYQLLMPRSSIPEITILGISYETAQSGIYPFSFPIKESIIDILHNGYFISNLFKEQPLNLVEAPYPGLTIDGITGYYKVKPGQKYATIDEMTTELRKYFVESQVSKHLALKTYVIFNDELYGKSHNGHGGFGRFDNRQLLFISDIDVANKNITFNSFMPGEYYYDTGKTIIQLVGDKWLISIPYNDPSNTNDPG